VNRGSSFDTLAFFSTEAKAQQAMQVLDYLIFGEAEE
jgi:hypothetical protein